LETILIDPQQKLDKQISCEFMPPHLQANLSK